MNTSLYVESEPQTGTADINYVYKVKILNSDRINGNFNNNCNIGSSWTDYDIATITVSAVITTAITDEITILRKNLDNLEIELNKKGYNKKDQDIPEVKNFIEFRRIIRKLENIVSQIDEYNTLYNNSNLNNEKDFLKGQIKKKIDEVNKILGMELEYPAYILEDFTSDVRIEHFTTPQATNTISTQDIINQIDRVKVSDFKAKSNKRSAAEEQARIEAQSKRK